MLGVRKKESSYLKRIIKLVYHEGRERHRHQNN